MKSRLFTCSGASTPAHLAADPRRTVIPLATHGRAANVHLRLEDVARTLTEDLSPRLLDFLEIAAYVYAADASTTRDGTWEDDHTTEPWDRTMHFVIPVRDLAFWQTDDVQQALRDVLDFLSSDEYRFDFVPLVDTMERQQYLDIGDQDDWPFYKVDRVLMFSGGLDSLAGAVDTAAAGKKLVLVSHRPVSTLSQRQSTLFAQLKATLAVPMIHVPVWVNKDERLGREHTQRTRSFLFCALGTAIAASVRAAGVRFFENGIVSMNLPIADEIQRSRASRTTHPRSLQLLSHLCSLVTGRDFTVDNPFIFKTKADVVSLIAARKANGLIPHTCSYAHTGRFHSKVQWHCGACSQCIDRRVAILAAGLAAFDPQTDYRTDVFTGKREEGYETNMGVDYARHGIELDRLGEDEIARKFNAELSRAVRYLPRPREAAEALVAMHKRHGSTVHRILTQQLQEHGEDIIRGALPSTSMLALIAGQRHLTSSWKRYGDRLARLLKAGIPKACATHRPKDEPHLQQLCDGILQGHDDDLTREFPFMRWSSTLTKPDWSVESLQLWVELKYVRQKSDIREITEAIAADITKYGDNERRVLYVVYDPSHHITDDCAFARQIVCRPTMWVHFIR